MKPSKRIVSNRRSRLNQLVPFRLLTWMTGLILVFGAASTATLMAKTTGNETLITVTVKDGKNLQPLTASHFVVTDNGQLQNVNVMAGPHEPSPLHVALVLEEGIAGSINNELPDLRRFVQQLPAGAQVMVAIIDRNHSRTVIPFTSDFQKAAQSIPMVMNYVDQVPLSTFVSLSDVIHKFDGLSGRKEIVLIGSGFDVLQEEIVPTFNTDLREAEAKARDANVVIHTLWVPPTGVFSEHFKLIGVSNLQDLSDATGGLSFWNVDRFVVQDLTARLNRIREAFDNQYILAFSPDIPSNRGHRIRVTLRDVPNANKVKVSYPVQ